MTVPFLRTAEHKIIATTGLDATPTVTPPVGSLVIVAINTGVASVTYTPPAGWTTVLSARNIGSRSVGAYMRITTGTDSYAFTQSLATGATVMIAVYGGTAPIADIDLGTWWARPGTGVDQTVVRAPAQAITGTDSAALALFFEASNGVEAAGPGLSSGWTTDYTYYNTVNSVSIQSITLGRKNLSIGAGEEAVATYVNSQVLNGGGLQIIVPGSSAPVTTGRIGAHGIFAFGTDYLSVGGDKLGGTATAAVLYDAAGVTELARATITHDGTTGWGSTTFSSLTPNTDYLVKFEVDGVTQADAQARGKTPGTTAGSFRFVAGSCQFTGSNHPIFDRMREFEPAFVAHMGDLHYADTQSESVWRAAMESSLTASKMKALLEAVPMVWTPDNHDMIYTSPSGGGSATVMQEWKHLAGSTGWASEDSLGRSWRQGRVLFVQPDNRTPRDNYQTDAEPRTFLGSAQKTWLKNLLAAAGADSSIALIVWFAGWTSQNDANGRWNSYPTESAELVAHVDANPAAKAKLVMIGGDSHVLQATTGARTAGQGDRWPGIPSLNISGFNRSSQYTTGNWDIAEADLRTAEQAEADWGGYSRCTVTDNGSTLTFLWEGVRVNAAGAEDVMATFTRTVGSSSGLTADALYVGAVAVTAVYKDGVKLWG